MDVVQSLADLPDDDEWHVVQTDGTASRYLARVIPRREGEERTRYVGIMPLMYTHAIIWGYTDTPNWFEDRWCYSDQGAALLEATRWDPNSQDEPEGWHRHPASGRRRDKETGEEYTLL